MDIDGTRIDKPGLIPTEALGPLRPDPESVMALVQAMKPAQIDRLLDFEMKGRLWVRGPKDTLRRIGAVEALQRWAVKQDVAVITRLGKVTEQRSSSSSSYDRQIAIFDDGSQQASSHSTSRTVDVIFTRESVIAPQLLQFVRDGDGVQGVGEMPANGGSVRVSDEYEFHGEQRRAYFQWLVGYGSSAASASGKKERT